VTAALRLGRSAPSLRATVPSRWVRWGLATVLSAVLLPGLVGAAGTVGAQFLNLPLSVRQMGMGNVSVGGRDVLRAWSNPSLLADQARRGEVAFNGASMFGGDQTTFGFGAGWLLSPGWNVAALVSSYAVGVPEVGADGKEMGADLDRSLIAGGLAGAGSLGFAHVGVTVKMVSDSVLGDAASAVAADVGLSAVWESFSAGFAYRNLGPSLRAGEDPGDEAEVLPAELRGGVAFHLTSIRVSAGAEYAQTRGRDGRVGLGAEWWPVKALAVRAGVANVADAAGQVTAGLSALFRGLTLDYALAAHPVGATHKVSLSYAFGPTAMELAVARAAERESETAAEAAALATAPALVPVTPAPEPLPVKPAGLLNFAVADLTAQNVSAGDAAVITDLLRSELVKTKAFNILDRRNMEKVLAEHAFQQTGCTSDECAVKLGRLLNMQRMVVGSFGKLLSSYLITVQVVNVETGTIIFSETVKGRDEDELTKRVRELAQMIARQVR